MNLIYRIKPPCTKCPYTLGLVHTVTNPCPRCKANGYKTFERFKREGSGSDTDDKKEDLPIGSQSYFRG